MAKQAKQFEVVCAVCFKTHRLHASSGKKPVRHGFAIVTQGWGSGHWGAWHSGPCGGTQFPHLGLSTEGTKWALGCAQDHKAKFKAQLAELKAGPKQLVVEIDIGTRREPQTEKVVLTPGTEASYLQHRHVPSYDDELTRRITKTQNQLAQVTSDIKTYEGVITNWKPAKPTPVESKRQGPCLHKEHRGRPLCQQFNLRGSTGSARFAKSDDEVTCQRCLKSLQSRDKDAQKRAAVKAANRTYSVTLPNGEVVTTTNDRQGTKREIILAVATLCEGRWHVDWCVSEATAKKAAREAKKPSTVCGKTYRADDVQTLSVTVE